MLIWLETNWQIIVTNLVTIIAGTSIFSLIIKSIFDKKIRTHELKLQKYFCLIEELSKLLDKSTDEKKLRHILNEALFFSSDNVVREILKFNKLFSYKRNSSQNSSVQITSEEIKPLVKSIRNELYLKSKSLDKEELRFFQRL